ncbi:MAG: glycogen synthase GlgA [Acidobacteria bacterium]|nr:glycogen synthase GlgA [Acidobacteriota bacterium]
MNILFAASEAVPYAKTGGLADVAGALPKALARLGHRVRLVLPRYNLDPILQRSERLPELLTVPFDGGVRQSSVFIDRTGEVPVYFIDAPEFFFRSKLYGERDDPDRFAYFSRAILELAKAFNEQFDILHLNDWMTGLVPLYLKTVYGRDGVLAHTKTLFTIHNLAFHGLFSPYATGKYGLPEWVNRTDGGIEFHGVSSMLKAGLVFADAISTVSPRYSQEIQTPEYAYQFDGLLRARRHKLFGILNGVDYDEWSPENDTHIAARFSEHDLSGKRECKKDVLRAFGLREDLHQPLIGCVSRLSDQKGIDLILEVIWRVLDRGANFVLIGSGAEYFEHAFQALRDARPQQVGVYFGLSNELAHKVEAGADLFLMPSRFEPCGLNQLYSLKYGTVPIVRAVGGLDDTIQNFNRANGQGNGFKFYDYQADKLLEKIYEALMVYTDKALWRTLMLNGMKMDYSWAVSARHYLALYERLTRR